MSDDENRVYWAPTIVGALFFGSIALPHGEGAALIASIGGASIGQGIAEVIRLES